MIEPSPHSNRDNLLSSQESKNGGLAGRYASALFELMQELPADQQKSLTAEVADLLALLSANDELQKLIRSPVISAEEKTAAMGAVSDAAGMSQLLKNFVALVIEKRRAAALPAMAQHFAGLVASSRDELVAHVTTAQAIEQAQIDALKDQLKKAFGKTIVVEAEQDSALLGGMIVKVGSQMIDGSLRTKLDSLKTTLSGS